MTNEELIHRFESGEIAADSFHHPDHIRLAFAYLSHYAPLEALENFASALKCYAAQIGHADMYHETITHAYFFLIRERMARTAYCSWDEFIASNADLLAAKNGALSRYYHAETLRSELARSVFVLPDKSIEGLSGR